jgi:hypothetical protein
MILILMTDKSGRLKKYVVSKLLLFSGLKDVTSRVVGK